MARYLYILAIMLILVFPGMALSEENVTEPSEGAWYTRGFVPAQHFTLDQDISLRLGYRFVGLDGSPRAAQYEYLHDSVAGGLDFHYYPMPFMIDVEFDYLNEHDHDARVSLGYSDMVRLDYRNMALFHNLDHLRLIASTVPGNDLDPEKDYGVKVDENELKLVLKSPGRPYHLYVNLRRFEKSGTIQQRWDPAFFTNNSRSESRDINWITDELTAGINGNILGFLELDYHHTIKAFKSDLRSVLVDVYTNPAGTFAHNLVPDFETNEDVISIHTNQSKSLSAAGTFSWGDKVNKNSGARVDFHRESGDVSYRPFDNLFFAVKYGHQKLDVQNPDFVTGPPIITPVSPALVGVDSISTTRDRGVASVSYYPMPKLGLLAEYKLDSVSRTNAKSWSLPDDLLISKAASITHTGKVSATFTPVRHTKLRASFSYSHNGDPSYNTDYVNAYEGNVWGTWVPTPGLVFNAQYKLLRGDNPVRSEISDGNPELDERNSHTAKDNAGAGVSWFALNGLVVGANYDYLRQKTTTNAVLGSFAINKGTPYWDISHVYTVYANYCFSFPLKLETSFSQSWSKGVFRLNNVDLAADYDNLTDQKIRETRGTVKADYEIWRGWGTSLQYIVSNFRDQANVENPVTGERNGTAHMGMALLTKKW